MTISRVPRVPRVSVDRRGFHIFPRRVGPGTWYPYMIRKKSEKDVTFLFVFVIVLSVKPAPRWHSSAYR